MKTIADILKDSPIEYVHPTKKFHWGTIDFNTQTIHLNKHITYVELYCDVVDLMDDFDMMSYEMPFYMVTRDEISFNDKWRIKTAL